MNERQSPRRRVRLIGMAAELGISERKMRELLTLGVPYTQIMGIILLEPDEVHEWLDKFKRRNKGKFTRKQAFEYADEDADEAIENTENGTG